MASTAYTWELGIDWNGIETAGLCYLRNGFVKNAAEGNPAAMAQLSVNTGDTITFKIFDVTSFQPSEPNSIKSFTVLVKMAVSPSAGQKIGDPLDRFQLTFPLPPQPQPQDVSTAFGGSFPLWLPEADVKVMSPGRYLLSFLVQAGPVAGNTLIFAVDPEMVVGPFT